MSSREPSGMPPTPPLSPVHEPHNDITVTHVIKMESAARLKREVKTIRILEERVQQLLRTTDNLDTIRHICRLFPFQDQNIPQVVLSQRWNSWLDSFLISLHGNLDAEQEILQLSREQKAEKLLRLLDPLQEKHSTMWTWAPPDLSGKPDEIAKAICKVIFAAFFQITLREWLAYFYGNEVAAVNRLLLGFECISVYINQLTPERYNLVKKALHPGDLLGRCVFDHDPPEQILRVFFHSPIEEALKCRNPSLMVERLALLNQRYIAMAEGAGGSHVLGGSITDAQSKPGDECLGFYAFWVVLCNVATMVAVKLLSLYQTWTIHSTRTNQVVDVEKCQQNYEAPAYPPGSTNSSDV